VIDCRLLHLGLQLMFNPDASQFDDILELTIQTVDSIAHNQLNINNNSKSITTANRKYTYSFTR